MGGLRTFWVLGLGIGILSEALGSKASVRGKAFAGETSSFQSLETVPQEACSLSLALAFGAPLHLKFLNPSQRYTFNPPGIRLTPRRTCSRLLQHRPTASDTRSEHEQVPHPGSW